jgi:hypothetical protein
MSIPLIQMLRTQGFGFHSRNLLTNETYYFACYTYVDDTDLVHTGTSSTSPTQIFTEMQSILDHWEGGLHATGRALVPPKSYWYGIDFKWHKTKLKWEYKTIAQLPGSLHMKDHQHDLTLLERLEVDEARETLGLWIAMDGNQVKQVLALLKEILAWADCVRTKQLTKTEVWLSLRLGIAKALQYPLAATNMSKANCKLLDKALIKAALPALGFPSSYPRVIAQAPPEVLGLGIPAIWNQQGIDISQRHYDMATASTKYHWMRPSRRHGDPPT